jgi:hypothetical protein
VFNVTGSHDPRRLTDNIFRQHRPFSYGIDCPKSLMLFNNLPGKPYAIPLQRPGETERPPGRHLKPIVSEIDGPKLLFRSRYDVKVGPLSSLGSAASVSCPRPRNGPRDRGQHFHHEL